MNKFVVIEVGSTNTKSFLYDNGEVKEYPHVTIEFKSNFKKRGVLDGADVSSLCALVKGFKQHTPNIFVFGTSVFRELKEPERKAFIAEFKKKTGCEFSVVTPEQESEYTVAGVTLGNDYNGRIAVMIGGGGSTEVCIIENKKIIERHCNNFGAVTVTQKFPMINDHRPNMTFSEVEQFCLGLTHDIKNKADILVLAGGDYIGFYECAGAEFLEKNKFFADKLQPCAMTMKNIETVDRRFVCEQDIRDYYKNYPQYNAAWWDGTRGMRFCVRAVTKKCGAKYVIPTKINMCLGIINELKRKGNKKEEKMGFNKNAYEILEERGFIALASHREETKKLLSEKPITFYFGIDPTADELHIGHFFAFQMFRILQDCGHRGILLLGGATAMIGDPSFKSEVRTLLAQEQVARNIDGIKKTLKHIVNLDGENPAIIVNNADWTLKRGYVEFMREVGSHFNVARMLAAECYKIRMQEGGLTFFEMGYMLMQANDFVHLNDKYGCVLQLCGSDQWGNVVAGVELSRKMSNKNGEERPLMVGLGCPLLTKSDGTKMGKTEKGALWLNKDKTSVYEFFQYFSNVNDADVEKLFRCFTMIPIAEITKMCKEDIVKAKKVMAFEVTKKLHGAAEAEKARATAEQLFSGAAAENTPMEVINIGRGASVVDALALTSIIKSKREARDLITAGGILIDGEKVTDTEARLDATKTEFLVKKGKKTFLKIKLTD